MNKNNNIRKHLNHFFCFSVFFLIFAVKINAQCTNVSMTLTRTNATCVSNGKILVTLSGSDVNNIRQSDMEFKVDGTLSRSWANYAGNTITNLPAGTYTVSMRAFCNSISDWLVFSNAVTTTLTSSYTEMDAYLGVTRKTLNCAPTGMVPIVVKANTGSSPFTITITNHPVSYTGNTSFSLTRVYDGNLETKEIEDLPAGSYTFTITDACSYTQTLNATVGKMDQDYDMNMFYPYVYPPHDSHSDCNVVGIYKYYITRPADENHYFLYHTYKYYDVGFKINGADPIIWVDTDSLKLSLFNFTLPFTIKTFRANSSTYKLTPYLKVKGSSCTFQLNDMGIYSDVYMSVRYSDVECTKSTVRFYPYSYSTLCYPYKWRIVKDGTVIYNWSSDVYNTTTQTATNVPYGSKIEYRDYDGYEWSSTLNTNPPGPSYSYTNIPCEDYGRTADTIHNYFYIYFPSVDVIPTGTKFEFVSGPVSPLHTNVTTTEEIPQFCPFSSDYKWTEPKYIPPGIYKFNVTLPGVGCTMQSVSVYHSVSYIKTPFTYTTKETCGGLNIIPTGGQLAYKNADGSTYDQSTYYYISSISPYASIERGPVELGDTLFFPTSAQYIFGMTYYQMGSCLGDGDTVDYVKTQFQLNPNVTAAYVCEGAGLGFIRVAGMGGSGNYSYELYDQGVKSATSSTGVFSYGTAGSIYTIRLIDTDPACAASYDQDVQMLDLTSAHILYTSSPTNTYCLDEDSIYLKCISLGQTTYTWTGPGVTSTNKNRQNLGIAISDLGKGSYTYSIKVTPEGCGTEMDQNITVKIEDCSGAQDDYLTLFVNTTDTIDILANDGFPSSCAGSVIPVVIVNPVNGSYSLVNKKVIYTPNLDYSGRDSLTYSTTCSGVTTTAKVYFTIVKKPDNIVDPNCWVDPKGQEWAIQRLDSVGLVTTVPQFFVGDMNDDGFPDIVACKNYPADGFKIFYGPDFNAIDSFMGMAPDMQAAGAIGKIKVSESPDAYESLIFYRGTTTNLLYAVRADGTSPWGSNPICDKGMIGLADFNGDGWTEVYVGNKIFDAATGKLLATGGSNNIGKAALMGTYSNHVAHPQAVDILGDTNLELVAGNQIYKVKIDRMAATPSTLEVISSVTSPIGAGNDGVTIVADFNNDGELEVLVRQRQNAAVSGNTIHLYLWSPHTGTSTGKLLANTTDSHTFFGIPFVGDIDGDGRIEIVTLGSNSQVANQKGFKARKYNETTKQFTLFWDFTHIDQSGGTGMTLFDFNLDGIAEIVYRDEYQLRIINGSQKSHITGRDTVPYTLSSFKSYSSTSFEYPVIVDIYGNGSSAILVTSDTGETRTSASQNYYKNVAYIDIFTSDPSTPWASARKVWNQYSYNAVNVNEDLTIPRTPMSIATVFPGKDGVLGTSDDVRPYNNIQQQQTTINESGVPFFLAPDTYSDESLVGTSTSGKSITVTVGILNQGDAAIGTPVYATLYKEPVSAANKIATGSFNGYIAPGDTGYVTIFAADVTDFMPMLKMVVRINDDGTKFPHQPECDIANNEIIVLNPAIHLMMKKDATLEGVPHNGTYENPVAALFNETIEYTITAVNANTGIGKVIIRDTLPPYLDFVSSNPAVVPTTAGSAPPRGALEWTIAGVASMATTTVTVNATPQAGSSASQPMFINRAWVTVRDTITVPTNLTYHQGASVGIATFSAGFGGNIYNAVEQALDYKTTPRTGIVIVPDEGYRFAGWSHEDYTSLRGNTIQAEEGIMLYDTLTVYGDVELQANFEMEEYPIEYHLNGSVNAGNNPPTYTIESGSIILGAPEKAEDVFTGWTGSNGETPERTVTIPKGSTGELEFYANFLRSGREDDTRLDNPEEDKIWAAKDELYIRTSKPGSIVRIYSTEGVLQKQQTILQAGEIKMKLLRGIYVVTLNNSIGKKIIIE